MLQMAAEFVPEFVKYAAMRGVQVIARKKDYLLVKGDYIAKLDITSAPPEIFGGGDWAKELWQGFAKVQALAQQSSKSASNVDSNNTNKESK